jgi:hypothetical protein
MSEDIPEAEPTPVEIAPVEIATGDRHEEVHFEADPAQLVVAKHLMKPDQPLPLDLQPSDPPGGASETDFPPVEDVLVAPEAPSVWDARPAEDDAGERGKPLGH